MEEVAHSVVVDRLCNQVINSHSMYITCMLSAVHVNIHKRVFFAMEAILYCKSCIRTCINFVITLLHCFLIIQIYCSESILCTRT